MAPIHPNGNSDGASGKSEGKRKAKQKHRKKQESDLSRRAKDRYFPCVFPLSFRK